MADPDPPAPLVVIGQARVDPAGACPVCSSPLGEAPMQCCICATPHHRECWEYNRGCATFSCPAAPPTRDPAAPSPDCAVCTRPPRGPTVRCRSCRQVHHVGCYTQHGGCGVVGCPSNPEVAAMEPLPEKILLPRIRVGLFTGVRFVPPTTVAWVIGMELLFIALGIRGQLLLATLAAWGMFAGIVWAAITAERFNINIAWRAITKSKLVGGSEILEWIAVPFDDVVSLELSTTDRGPWVDDAQLIVHARRRLDPRLRITPPVDVDGEEFAELVSLLRRIHAASLLPVPQVANRTLGHRPGPDLPVSPAPRGPH